MKVEINIYGADEIDEEVDEVVDEVVENPDDSDDDGYCNVCGRYLWDDDEHLEVEDDDGEVDGNEHQH